jgi:hypothetical protein
VIGGVITSFQASLITCFQVSLAQTFQTVAIHVASAANSKAQKNAL